MIFFARLALLFSVGLCSCGAEKIASFSGKTMGTTWNVQIAQPVSSRDRDAIRLKIGEELDRLENIFSTWKSDSEISRFNLIQTTEVIPVSSSLASVVSVALRISSETHGAFDPTLGPLIDLWGFGKAGRMESPPSPEEIQAVRQRCGAHHLQVSLDPPTLQKSIPNLEVNPSALVEGYAADQLGQWLRSQGYDDWLIEIGGEILASGNSLAGQPWKAGIQTPEAPEGELISSFPLQNAALATSGTYRQRFDHGGRSYSHVIDPRTGYPVETPLVSVSVVGSSCLLADAYATALLVLGRDQGEPLAKRLHLRVFWIQDSDR